MPAGSEVTVPLPCPAVATVSLALTVTGGVRETDAHAESEQALSYPALSIAVTSK
jgi:hypothetical protein